MSARTFRLSLLAGAVLFAAAAVTPQAAAAADGFSVPAQDLGGALMRLAKLSGRNILFSPDAVRGAHSAPVRNAASFDAAIREMLSGTGLVETVSGGTVIIQRPAPRAVLVRTALSTTRPAAESAPPPPAAPAVEEVTVTARKSKERLSDVPIAITAIGGAQLNLNEHRRIEDLNTLVPSTNFVITNGHQASYSIRGLGNNPGNDGLEGSAGVFLDGVFLGRPGMAATDLIDVDQIEVLRGPQGTLFGKNTTAGAISITTAAPSFTFGGRAQVSYGNYNFQQYQATVTGPLIGDVLAGRLTAYSTTRDGDISNLTTGQKTNNLDRTGIRGQLLFQPNDDFSLRVIGELHREQQSTGAVLTLNSLGATPAAMQTKLNAVGATLIPDPSGATTYINGPAQTGTRQRAVSVETNWNVNGFTLTTISAYRNWRYTSYSDTDATAADVLNGGYNIHHNQWSEELRVKFPRMGNVDAIAGLYYFQQKLRTDSVTEYGSEAAAWLSGIPNSLLPIYSQYSSALAGLMAYNNSAWDLFATPQTHSYAAFGQAIWHVTPDWNVTLGFRETYETKSETVWRPNPVVRGTNTPSPALASQVVAPFSVAVNNAAPSFLVSTDYHLTPSTMVFASVSQGEKAGGVNTTTPAAGAPLSSLIVQPETATDYEIGLRGDAFEKRLRYSLNAFYTLVANYQATFWGEQNGAIVQVLTNVGKVHTRGFEAEATAVPIEGLTLNSTASYNDAYYAAYPSGPCPAGTVGQSVCDLTGKAVAGAPRWIANVNGTYEHEIASGVTAYGSAEYSYRSHYYGFLDDSPYSRTGGYGLVNLRLGVRGGDGRWDLSVWGKNVTNVHYVSNYLSYGSLLPGAYVPFFGDFATYGATLRTQF